MVGLSANIFAGNLIVAVIVLLVGLFVLVEMSTFREQSLRTAAVVALLLGPAIAVAFWESLNS